MQVCASATCKSTAQVLVISHDAQLAGAQRLLLNLLAEWKRRGPFSVKVICLGPGPLRGEFEQLFPTLFLSDYRSAAARDAALVKFTGEPTRAIYSSTVVNGPLLEELRSLGVPVITHCHELQAAIERWAPEKIMATTLANSDFILAGCAVVARNLHIRHLVPNERLGTVYDFIDPWNAEQAPDDRELASLRSELGVTENDIVVFGCGTTDWRKGPDLFLTIAVLACEQDPRLKFVWIGGDISQTSYQEKISERHLTDRILFIGNRPLSRRYYYAGHIFALTSREDPCPLVALEAADAKLPVVCFDGAGDIPQVLGATCGAVVAFEDTQAFAEAVLQLSKSVERRVQAGNAGYERVRMHHSSQAAAVTIEEVIENVVQLPRKALGRLPGSPLVTVIIPNYNHQKFLKERLESVARQSLRDIEIIVLDDASTDNSRSILEAFVAGESRSRLLCNESNSGSTFKQWRRGLAVAQGKYIWIAESDDASKRHFLRRTVLQLESDSSVVVANSHSLLVDAEGKVTGRPDEWLNELDRGRWDADFVSEGITEIRDYLCQKNTIPNASAVVFRNFSGIEFLVDDTMRLCADWLFWIRLLARGKYAFVRQELNFWRQNTSNARTHPPGVMEWEEGQRILGEVAGMLNLTPAKREQMVERFHERCVEWSGGRVQ
jgi:hypothetical protein